MTILKFIIIGPFILIASLFIDFLVFFLNLFSFPETIEDNVSIEEQSKYNVILSQDAMNIYLESVKEVQEDSRRGLY
jgi:hypothetical protein